MDLLCVFLQGPTKRVLSFDIVMRVLSLLLKLLTVFLREKIGKSQYFIIAK